MARPLRQLSPESDALWGRALEAHESGELTIEDLCGIVGAGKSTVYARLKEARERREDEPGGSGRPEIDEAVWLELIGSVRGLDGRNWYSLSTDATSHDGTGAAILTTNHNGTRLRRNRLGTGDHVKDPGGPTKHQPDPDGLKGGVG